MSNDSPQSAAYKRVGDGRDELVAIRYRHDDHGGWVSIYDPAGSAGSFIQSDEFVDRGDMR